MGLHAFRLGFAHPSRREPMLFETEPPPEFRPYL
jgi:23S rRNA-/tRNA-specific pseudouridylate synthase